MEHEVLAPNSDSDEFSDELFDGTSDCGDSFGAEVNTKAVDCEGSPNPVWSTASVRGADRRLSPPLENATAKEPERLPPESDAQERILEELTKVSSRLESVFDRLDALDSRLQSVERNQLSSSTPSSSASTDDGSGGKRSKKVPAKVAVSLCSY